LDPTWGQKYFALHNYASARRKKNFITKLKDEAENLVEGTDALKHLVLNYFTNLFTSKVQETDHVFLEKVQPRVTRMINEKLMAPFTAKDVKKAMFSIGDFKAPGPDGLHAVFYKKFWDLSGDEITQEVLLALNSGQILKGVK
jgi:hypothetical protein